MDDWIELSFFFFFFFFFLGHVFNSDISTRIFYDIITTINTITSNIIIVIIVIKYIYLRPIERSSWESTEDEKKTISLFLLPLRFSLFFPRAVSTIRTNATAAYIHRPLK